MRISIKNGILMTVVGIIGLVLSFGISFGDCFKSECNEQDYIVISIIWIILTALGLITLFIGVVLLSRANPRKRYWLIITIMIYSSIAFGVYYYFLGGNRFYEAKGFRSSFKSTYFSVSYLPEGYVERHTNYSIEQTSSVYGPGNYSRTQFGKPYTDSNGNTYYDEFYLEQGDEFNNAAGIFEFCGKKYECDVVNGKNTKNINCQKINRFLCSVKLDGTYISIGGSDSLSREEAIAILDSLVPK